MITARKLKAYLDALSEKELDFEVFAFNEDYGDFEITTLEKIINEDNNGNEEIFINLLRRLD